MLLLSLVTTPLDSNATEAKQNVSFKSLLIVSNVTERKRLPLLNRKD